MVTTKQCPFCAEDIRSDAVLCRFCQRELSDERERVPRPVRPERGRSIWLGVLLAPIVAGSIAALTNLTNFVASRPTYFAIWGAAHLLVFGFGLWTAVVWRGAQRTDTYVLLGLVAGAVEAGIVFGVLDGLVIVNSRFPFGAELVTGIEDYVAAVSTVLLFTAGALHGWRRQLSRAPSVPVVGPRGAPLPNASANLLTVAGPLVTLAAGVLKELL